MEINVEDKNNELLSSSEEDNEKNAQYISIEGIVWKEMQIGTTVERAALHNIFRKGPGPTGYAKHKYFVGMIHQMARKYVTKSKFRRWSVQVFFNILSLARINAWLLYKEYCMFLQIFLHCIFLQEKMHRNKMFYSS